MRTIVINEETWKFKIGPSHVRIVTPTGKSHDVSSAKVAGVDENTWERGQWKRTSDGMIGPGQVRKYIEENLSWSP